MMGNMHEATMVHAEIISILHGACFKETWNKESITEIFKMAGTIGFLVSTSGGSPEGFILFRVTADEAEVLSIGVMPSARKKGLGSKLLKKSIERAASNNVTKMFIEVAEDNKAAIYLYKKFGFVIIGKRRGYYKRSIINQDAIIFRLNVLTK